MREQNMTNDIDAQAAAASLAAVDELADRMRKDVIAMGVAVGAFGLGSAAAMLLIGLVGMNGSVAAIIAGTILLVASMLPLQVVAARAKSRAPGFNRRYLGAIAAWGIIYVTGLAVGGFVFPGVLAFWIPVAVLSAVPGIWFAVTTGTRR
jgi:hypothetical protein